MLTSLAANLPYIDFKHYNQIELGAIASIMTGCPYPQYEWPQQDTEPFVVVEKLHNNAAILSATRYIRVSERERRKYILKKGDILFQHNTSAQQLGKSVLFDLPDPVLHTKYLRIVPNPDINSQFLLIVLNTLRLNKTLHAFATERLKVSNIKIEALKKIKVPLPTLEEQLSIVKCFLAHQLDQTLV